MKTERIRKTRKNEKGQSLVEFALVVPLLLILVLGIVEFGRAWMTKNILTGAAREAVRVAAMAPPVGGPAAGNIRGNQFLASAGMPQVTNVTEVTEADGHTTTIATVTYDFQFIFRPFFVQFMPGIPGSITLTSTTTMRREY